MKKIEIAHEAPISILDKVRERTDYDYALVHLFETHPRYFKLFQDSLKMGRKVILDNSIFELGEAFDPERYAYWIDKLRPTEYIIPDVLESTVGTIDNYENWISRYSHLPGTRIGVVQGRTFNEIVDCYNYFNHKSVVEKIAISFDYSYYKQSLELDEGVELSKRLELNTWMLGRIKLLERLLFLGVINVDKPHHLLGCSLVQEFSHYRDKRYDWIESLDTSNPVVLGIKGSTYDSENGLSYKPSIKLFELIDSLVDDFEQSCIVSNINDFKKIVNG